MFYAPHSLYLKTFRVEHDENGFSKRDSQPTLTYVCKCRCDDDNTTEVTDERGHVFRAAFHIVADKCNLKRGDVVVVKERGCEGQIRVLKTTNYYNYTEIWI